MTTEPLIYSSIHLLFITDSDGDETYEGAYATHESAEEQAQWIREWDFAIKEHRIIEDYVRETSDS